MGDDQAGREGGGATMKRVRRVWVLEMRVEVTTAAQESRLAAGGLRLKRKKVGYSKQQEYV